MKNSRRITEWVKENESVETNKGSISLKDWCDSEAKRINGKGGSAEVIQKLVKGVLYYSVSRLITETSKTASEE